MIRDSLEDAIDRLDHYVDLAAELLNGRVGRFLESVFMLVMFFVVLVPLACLGWCYKRLRCKQR